MTAQLLKRLLAVALAAAVCLGFAGQASAGYALTNTNLNANVPVLAGGTGTAPLPGVTYIDVTNLRFWTNTFAVNSNGTADVRTVFAGTLSAAHDNVSYSPILGPGTATTSMTILGAVQGTASPLSGGNFLLDIQKGGFGLYASSKAINDADPTTWTTPNTPTTAFATFTLAPKGAVFPGAPGNTGASAQFSDTASVTNQSSINSTDASKSQGTVLFNNSTGASTFLLPGSVSGAPQPPSGLIATFGQKIETTVTTANAGNGGTFSSTDLGILNGIQMTYTSLQWATGVGGTATSNWNPTFTKNSSGQLISANGDFRATAQGAELNPFAAVPEPSSIVLMGMGLGSLALAIRRRKNQVPA